MWTEHVLNPQLIPSIFKKDPPSFNEVELRELKISFGEDIVCEILFDLKEFSDGLPVKWIDKGCNTIQFAVSFIGSTINQIAGLSTAIIGNLLVTYQNEEFIIIFQTNNEKERLNLTAKWANLNRITAYIKS